MNDPGFNNLLKWSIENSATSRNDPSAPAPTTQLDTQALGQLMSAAPGVIPGMKMISDADAMKYAMAEVEDSKKPLKDRITAFKKFEDLVTRIDNAVCLEHVDEESKIELWVRLVTQLENEEPLLRALAAESIASAVENNTRCQERLLALGTIPTLVKLGTEDAIKEVRKKAILALSSVSRNFQPGLDAVIENVPEQFKPKDKLDSSDMDSVSILINSLRAEFAKQD